MNLQDSFFSWLKKTEGAISVTYAHTHMSTHKQKAIYPETLLKLRAFKVGVNVMRKPALCICGNKGAVTTQLISTFVLASIPLLPKSEISSV